MKKKSKGPLVSGNDFSAILEGYERKMGDRGNSPGKQPADISQAFARSKNGSSKKPRVKLEKIKGK